MSRIKFSNGVHYHAVFTEKRPKYSNISLKTAIFFNLKLSQILLFPFGIELFRCCSCNLAGFDHDGYTLCPHRSDFLSIQEGLSCCIVFQNKFVSWSQKYARKPSCSRNLSGDLFGSYGVLWRISSVVHIEFVLAKCLRIDSVIPLKISLGISSALCLRITWVIAKIGNAFEIRSSINLQISSNFFFIFLQFVCKSFVIFLGLFWVFV